MNPYLILQQKGKHYLLVRYPDRFHLITVDRKLTDEKEEWLLGGIYSDAALGEAGLTRETIRLEALRGVAVSGPETGETVTLYIGKKKRTWQLSDDSTESDLNGIFEGIERFRAPQKRNKQDWRGSLQKEQERKILFFAGYSLNVLTFVLIIVLRVMPRRNPIGPLLALAHMVTTFGLYLLFPQYFSAMDKKEYKKAGYQSPVCSLFWSMILVPLVLWLDVTKSLCFLDVIPLTIGCIVCGILLSILMLVLSRELKEQASYVLVILVALTAGSFGLVGSVNHMLNPNTTQTQLCEVQQTGKSGSRRGGTSYSCTVTLENGEEVNLDISREDYERMGRGDWVEVYAGPGAIGIEYAYFVSWISRG